ncbi:MAG: Uma2 family endonuclease [Thermoleophilaceae bacterium]
MATETPTRRRFTVHDYHRMGESGISEDDRVELIDGEIVQMTPVQDVTRPGERARGPGAAVGRYAVARFEPDPRCRPTRPA